MFQTRVITGLDEFRQYAERWDRLWADSVTPVASLRAKPLIQFVEAFSKPENFAAVVAHQGDHWFTGIPLLIKRNRFGRLVGQSVANEWSARDGVLDIFQENSERFVAIEKGFQELGLSSIQLTWCPLDSAASRALMSGWKSRGRRVFLRPRFLVGQLDLRGDWSGYWSGLSRNRRKKLQKGLSELTKQGAVEFVAAAGAGQASDQQAIEMALEIELASWKGLHRSAILNHERVAKFFWNWAADLAETGLLRIYFLTVEGKPIAFDLGYVVSGVYTSHKVAYLNEFAAFSPGQLLTIKLIEHFYQTGEAKAIDFLGPLSTATDNWSNTQYPVGKLTLSAGTMISDFSVFAMGTIAELLKPSAIKI
jgi:hypothetical protein